MRLERQSNMDKKSRDLEEEEMLLQAIQASQQEEMDRQQALRDQRRADLERRKLELANAARAQQDELGRKYKSKEEQLLAEEAAR